MNDYENKARCEKTNFLEEFFTNEQNYFKENSFLKDKINELNKEIENKANEYEKKLIEIEENYNKKIFERFFNFVYIFFYY